MTFFTVRSLTPSLPLFLLAVLGVAVSAPDEGNPDTLEKRKAEGGEESLKALLITGGCCHDYNSQKVIIPGGISERAKVDWTIVHEGGTSRNH